MSSEKPIRLYGLAGSLRNESFSKAILKAIAEAIAPEVEMITGDIGALPHYNQDLDGDASPAPVVAMRKVLSECHGLVLSSPEYNYAMPGVLKNAIDWLSRPAFKSSLVGKPFVVITSSPAFTGGVRAQCQLREALMAALAKPVTGPEIVIASVHTKITDGKFTDKSSIDLAMKAVRQLIS